TYDAEGRITQTQAYATALTPAQLTALPLSPTTTQIAGDITATSSDRIVAHTYDQDGRVLTQTVDPGSGHLNLVTTYTYDKDGRVLTATDPSGAMTRAVYDAAGRKVYAIGATGAVAQSTYDADGNVVGVRAYATLLTPTQLAALGPTPSLATVAADLTTS